MKRSKESSMSLEEQFECPMSEFGSKEAVSASEVDKILESIKIRLTKNEDWSIRNDALREAIEYLNGGIDKYPNCDYGILASGIANCVSDLRSSLVKTGSLLIAASANVWKCDYVGSIEILVPALFKQLSHGTAVIANSCRLALLSIARNVQHRRTFKMFVSNQRSKNVAHREVVAEALSIMKASWPISIIDPLRSDLTSLLTEMCNDAASHIRRMAKEAMNIVPTPTKLTPRNKVSTPLAENRVKARLTPTRGRSKTPTRIPQLSSSITKTAGKKDLFREMEDIAECIPPKTKDQADCFTRLLKKHIETGDYEALIGIEEFLPDAIISSVRFIPAESAVWKPLIPVMFTTYNNEFLPHIRKIVVAFEVSSWLMDIVVQKFNPNILLESFASNKNIDDEDAFALFSGLFSRSLDVEINDEIRLYLEKLAEANQNEDDVCLIETALEVSKPQKGELDILLDSLVEKIRGGKSWLSKYRKLVVVLSDTRSIYQRVQDRLVADFKRIFNNQISHEISNVMSFLSEVCQELLSISFADLVESMLPFTMASDLLVKNKTEECIGKLMKDQLVVSRLIQILKESKDSSIRQGVLGLFLSYISSCEMSQMMELMPSFMVICSELLKSEVTAIRRIVTFILVEFKCRDPDGFAQYSKVFAPGQQKLISLYSSKRCH